MKYYDIVLDTCRFDSGFPGRLGFERVFSIKEGNHMLFIGSGKAKVLAAMQNGAVAVAITDFSLDKQGMARVADNGAILCVPVSYLARAGGLQQAKMLHRASYLVKYAYKKGIEVSFVSLAGSQMFMNSRMQLIELAKMLGTTEELARHGVSEANRKIIEAAGEGK